MKQRLAAAVALCVFLGCGGGLSSGTDGAERFTGTWWLETSSFDLESCMSDSGPLPLGSAAGWSEVGYVHVEQASQSRLRVSYAGNAPGCILEFEASGSTATVLPGQNCDAMPTEPVFETLSLENGGTILRLEGRGDLPHVTPGVVYTCRVGCTASRVQEGG